MLSGVVWFCRWSVAPLRLGFPGGADDAEATMLQKNNSPSFFCSPMAIYSDVN
jgi:hypothetical protein